MNKENKETIKKELQELGSSLGQKTKDTGFALPDGYFDELPAKIHERRHRPTERSLSEKPVSTPRRMLALAASMLLLIALGISLFLMQGDTGNDYMAYDEEMVDFDYFALQADFDQDVIYQMVLDSDLSADEILYDLYYADDGYDFDDEMIEMIFEEAEYYGIETGYLISSLN